MPKRLFFLFFSCLFYFFSCKTTEKITEKQVINVKDSVWAYDFTVRMALDLMQDTEYDTLRAPKILQWSVKEQDNFLYPFLFYTAFQKKCAANGFPDYIAMIKRKEYMQYVQDSITDAPDEVSGKEILRCFGTPLGSDPFFLPYSLSKTTFFLLPTYTYRYNKNTFGYVT